MNSRTREILDRFPALSALVVGDICLDRWCTYDATLAEESRETGIPRIAVVSTEVTPGAGGTVANNLAALGVGRVSVLGVVGEDGFGFELKSALRRRGINPDLLVESAAVPTFTYTKLLSLWTGAEDQPRIDFINTQPMPAALEDRIIERLTGALAAGVDVVLVSDQAETDSGGVVTPRVRDAIGVLAEQYPSTVFWVDSRLRAEHFRGVIVKPNEREAEEACRRAFGKLDLMRLRDTVGGRRPLIVTHGGEGAEIWEPGAEKPVWVATRKVEDPVDICGAGDSFSAGAAMTMAATGSPVDAVRMGNLVASITIMKKGTGTASPAEVLAAGAAS